MILLPRLTPLNDLLELLLIGEGLELDVMGIVQIGGGNGYDYGIIPLLEAFGLTANEVKTIDQYKTAVRNDETQLLGYILNRIAYFADRLLDKPVDTLLGILPNLAYYFSNEGLLLTVKNLLAPVYTILTTVTSVLGVDIESFLKLEELVHNIDLGIVIFGTKYDFKISKIDWLKLAAQGGCGTHRRLWLQLRSGGGSAGLPGLSAGDEPVHPMETMLADGSFAERVQKLKQTDRTLWEKIRDWFVSMAEGIRKAYEKLKPDSREGQMVAEMVEAAERLKDLFAEGLVDAADNLNGAEKNTAGEGGEVKYSLRETADGRMVAVIDSDILSHIDTSTWDKEKKRQAQSAAKEALKKFEGGIVVSGVTHKVTKVSRDEYTRSNYTDMLYRKNPAAYADKMRAAANLDDVVVAATGWSKDGALKHPRNGNFIDFARGNTLIQSGEIYKITIPGML